MLLHASKLDACTYKYRSHLFHGTPKKKKQRKKKTLYLLDKKDTNEERTESDGLTCFVGFMTV